MNDQILKTLRIEQHEDVPDDCIPTVGILIYETLHSDGSSGYAVSMSDGMTLAQALGLLKIAEMQEKDNFLTWDE